jgi:threonine/homoserine/homoserine lactone efflux protein
MTHLFPEINVFLAFLGACWVLQTSPGPDMMLIVSNGVGRGTGAALKTVFGIFLGGAVQAPLLALGTVSLIATYEHAFDILRAAGAAYLSYLAYRSFRNVFANKNVQMKARTNAESNPILEGFVTNISNPKVLLFLFAFIPQFTTPENGRLGLQLLILLTILKLNGLFINGSVALLSGKIKNRLAHRNIKFNWSAMLSGTVFLGIAIFFWYQILPS